MSGARVSVCRSCGWRGFPPRLWCPACGADRLGEDEVRTGRVEDATVLRRAAGRPIAAPVRLGTVLLEGGGRAISRLVDAGAGQDVDVAVEQGVLVARRSAVDESGGGEPPGR